MRVMLSSSLLSACAASMVRGPDQGLFACMCNAAYPYCWASGTGHDNKCYKSSTSTQSTNAVCSGTCTSNYAPTPPAPKGCTCSSAYPYCWNSGTGNNHYCYRSETSNTKSNSVCPGDCTGSYPGPGPSPPSPAPRPTPRPTAPCVQGSACNVRATCQPSSRRPGQPFEPGACPACDQFCDGCCGFYNTSAGETGQTQRITLYRITPNNVTGLRNKDTGDAPGDVGYTLSKKNLTRQCATNPGAGGCLLDGDNLYGKFVVEFDGQYGPYLECNPTNHMKPGSRRMEITWTDSSNFQCGIGCLYPVPPTAREPDGCKTYARNQEYNTTGQGRGYSGGVVQCFCDGSEREKRAVGREVMPFGRIYSRTPSWPLQCGLSYVQPQGSGFRRCPVGTPLRTVSSFSPEAALAAACNACDLDMNCSGWSIPNNATDRLTVTLLSGRISTGSGCVGGLKYSHGSGSAMMSGWPIPTGGYWYSTPMAGECADGAPIGTNGCTWRTVSVTYKNASCINSRLDSAIEARGKACLDSCPQPLDRISDCYLLCYRNALIGDPSYNFTKMTADELVTPWEHGFDADGCPDVTPLPCDGPQCGHL